MEILLDAFLKGNFPDPTLFTTDAFLREVHWSWFIQPLKTYPESDQKLFLSSLGASLSKKLAKALELLSFEEEISPLAKEYFHEMLLNHLFKHPPLPIAYLPQTPLIKLLHLSKKELIHIIDLLAMNDLSFELRQIVETKILKKIYSFLSEEERKVLKTRSPGNTGRLGLSQWDGSKESFRAILHRKGLARLAAAISAESKDFLWHLCHKLDVGRGVTLMKLHAVEAPISLRNAMIEQIEELL